MKRKIWIIVGIIGIIFILNLKFTSYASDPTCTPDTQISNRSPEELIQIINDCEKKLNSIRSKINTLSSEIAYMNTQIYLTQLKINKTEKSIQKLQEQIKLLDSKIEDLDASLEYLSRVFIKLAESIYKSRPKSLFTNIILSKNFNDALLTYKYLKEKQSQNQRLMLQVQRTKINFEEQKKLREEKAAQLKYLSDLLKKQKEELRLQQLAKKRLLELTKNDERKYQLLLLQAKQEYQAVTAILAGQGNEIKIKEVKQGEVIATMIPGRSCNSFGTHVHFSVKQNGEIRNPFDYLGNVDFINDSGDPFNPKGSWPWPVTEPVRLTQGFGLTHALRYIRGLSSLYKFHNGLDITSNALEVFSVADGTLYKGFLRIKKTRACPNGILPYVKVVHKEDGIVTYYLHVYSKY